MLLPQPLQRFINQIKYVWRFQLVSLSGNRYIPSFIPSRTVRILELLLTLSIFIPWLLFCLSVYLFLSPIWIAFARNSGFGYNPSEASKTPSENSLKPGIQGVYGPGEWIAFSILCMKSCHIHDYILDFNYSIFSSIP